jgi:uncharacterized protein (DUF1015 family)
LATIKPFQPYRYSAKVGDPAHLLTQPYDKISPQMQAAYLAASPYNLVRIILGERHASDDESNDVYTRSAKYLDDWIREGILAQDPAPGLYAYFQEFEVPDTGERALRKGFIGIGKVENYSASVVHRHEQTLSGPKKDRLELLRKTRAHFGQIFMLYPDPEGAVDRILDEAAKAAPILDVLDGDGARHRAWAITNAATIAAMQDLMALKKLLIADGHHRYETALAYRNEHPGDAAAEYVMMTFVNMYSPGLKILATHRVLSNLENFEDNGAFFLESAQAGRAWNVQNYESLDALKQALSAPNPKCESLDALTQETSVVQPKFVRIGMVAAGKFALLERRRQAGELDVPVLHREILGDLMGISEEAVREEKFIHYVRGMDAAVAQLKDGAQVVFLLEPTPIEDMARIAFAGGVMPQKSTDFYPKLLSGVTIYRL